MKKLISLLIGCSLALAGAALAQQPVEQQSPSKGKRPPEKARATQAQPRPNAAKPETPAAKQHGAMKGPPAANQPGAMKERGATHEPARPMSPARARAEKLQRPRALRMRRERTFPVNGKARRHPVQSSRLSSGGKG